MSSLLLDKITHNVVERLPWGLLMGQDSSDHLRDLPQAFAFITMLSFEIADAFGCEWVPCLQFLKNHVLFRMVATVGIVQEITDDRVYDFIVGPIASAEDIQLVLQNEKHLFNIPMFFA